MKKIETELPGVSIIEPVVYGDHRGFFMETHNNKAFAEIGIKHVFVQDNHSKSSQNVLRGLHYQLGHPQAKLIRVIQGEVYDVAVDVRVGSPYFGKWAGVLLSEENRKMLFVPEGFAHGFYVISDYAQIIYKCSEFYYPKDERGLIWNDPEIGIDWRIPTGTEPVLSEKDSGHPTLKSCDPADLPVYKESGA
ncbi:MAG: dTDP-4-dehydrorhamnose 3,5-epimerase [Planctomycetes bacterium]|nr:dTDP-4-dehydrorhamnose 3,5-epimerase [Planctomycetota bacterium]